MSDAYRKARALSWLLAAAIGCATTLPARREPPVRAATLDDVPPFYLHGDMGFGLPEGLAGGGVGVHPLSFANVELGGGLSNSGPQAAAMLALHPRVNDQTMLGLASGVSVGPQTENEPDNDDGFDEDPATYRKRWDAVLWSNSELQVRSRVSERLPLLLRVHFGLGVPVAHSEPSCKQGRTRDGELRLDAVECARSKLGLVPYLGVGIDYPL